MVDGRGDVDIDNEPGRAKALARATTWWSTPRRGAKAEWTRNTPDTPEGHGHSGRAFLEHPEQQGGSSTLRAVPFAPAAGLYGVQNRKTPCDAEPACANVFANGGSGYFLGAGERVAAIRNVVSVGTHNPKPGSRGSGCRRRELHAL